jgi:glutamate/tyrosine decarboxylase-like PLP-dependent enzyme
MMHVDHPRFFAFIPSPSNFVSAMADALAAGFNVFSGTWLEGSGPTQIELVTIDWLRQICGLPDTTGGLFVSGGSMANLTALAIARETKLKNRIADAIVYCSDQTHSSIDRGLRVLGFRPAQIRKIPSDKDFRLVMSRLRRAVIADRATGRNPFCVVANVGTTNTAAVDPLPELADFCSEEGLWLHADGAYGAAAMLSDEKRYLLEGLERVDSLILDPHKWLFQPHEMGCVLVRDGRRLRQTFRMVREYTRDVERAEEEVNLQDCGIQMTRGFRALKLWMSLKVFGLEAFREGVARGIARAELAEATLGDLPRWEIVTPAQLGIVTFRYDVPGRSAAEIDALNLMLVEEMIEDGFAMVSSTVLKGRTVLRMCINNPRTTEADIRETIRRLDHYGNNLSL